MLEELSTYSIWYHIQHQRLDQIIETINKANLLLDKFGECMSRKDIEGMNKVYMSVGLIEMRHKEEVCILGDLLRVMLEKILEMKREEV